MVIHGGLDQDGQTLSDWGMFDFKLQMWLLMVVKDADGAIFAPALRMHSMTAYQN
jgi:hypothetical protein